LLTLAVASAAVFITTSVLLARRVGEYNQTHLKPLFYSIRMDDFEQEFAGRAVVFTPQVDEQGEGVVTLRYGEGSDAATVEMPVQIPQPIELPGLDRYTDWLHAYYMAENVHREPFDEFRRRVDTGEVPVRMIVVERRVNPGVREDSRSGLQVDPDAWGWGETMRHRWSFAFHELLPDGTIRTHVLKMPESGASFYRRQVRAHQRAEPPPTRAEDELKEGTWEWDIALRTMPRPPAITMEKQALLNAGWTLPVASGSAIATMVCLAFAFAPARTRGSDSA